MWDALQRRETIPPISWRSWHHWAWSPYLDSHTWHKDDQRTASSASLLATIWSLISMCPTVLHFSWMPLNSYFTLQTHLVHWCSVSQPPFPSVQKGTIAYFPYGGRNYSQKAEGNFQHDIQLHACLCSRTSLQQLKMKVVFHFTLKQGVTSQSKLKTLEYIRHSQNILILKGVNWGT
jgi:hypothetical protein